MSWGVSPWVYPVWDSLGFLDLGEYFLPNFREVFNYYLLKYFLMVFLFVFFFWDSYDSNVVEINESERKKEKRIKRNEDNFRDLQENIKRSNIQSICVPEEEDKKKDHEKILEEMIVENFPKIGKEIIPQVQETQRVPNRINPRRNTPRHILIKLTKIKHKEQILKAAREKQQITHKSFY